MLLSIKHPASGSAFKADVEQWMAALVSVLWARPRIVPDNFRVIQGSHDRHLSVVIARTSVKQPQASWLVYVLQRITREQREEVDRFVRGADITVRTAGAERSADELSLVLPYALSETSARLEVWIGAVLQALDTDTRGAVFGAVDGVRCSTPGRYVLHAEMPAFGGR